jgi:hypothetical protein
VTVPPEDNFKVPLPSCESDSCRPSSPDYGYGYDRYGNRFAQAAYQGGYNFYPSIDPATNHITTRAYTYDAAGNMTSDAVHTYRYDAEGNILQVDGGSTAKYVYDRTLASAELGFVTGALRLGFVGATGGAIFEGVGAVPGAILGGFIGGVTGAAGGVLKGAAIAGVCSLAGVY